MNSTYIWSEQQLEELIRHPEPEVQEWAVDTFFDLYPDSAERRLKDFLQSEHDTIVRSTLQHLGENIRKDIIPVLRDIYLERAQELSALAIYILGNWRIPEAVEWMQNRILEGSLLSGDQIAAMLSALGSIPGETAYDLLKSTESAIREEKSTLRWEIFHTSLLKHRKREDVETIGRLFTDSTEREDRRRKALAIILSQIDPAFNPSEAVFGNYGAVQNHLKRRLDFLEAEMAQSEELSDLGPWIEEMRSLLQRFRPDAVSDLTDTLGALGTELKWDGCFERDVFEIFLALTKDRGISEDSAYTLACVAASSLLEGAMARLAFCCAEDSPLEDKLAELLKDRPPKPYDGALERDVVDAATPGELIPRLTAVLEGNLGNWAALRAIEMLGMLKASDASSAVVRSLRTTKDELLLQAAEDALLKMDTKILPVIIPLLDAQSSELSSLALRVLGRRPTEGAVEAITSRFSALFERDPRATMDTAGRMAAREFLPAIEKEYRTGEWVLANLYAHICRVNQLSPPNLREIELDAQRGKEFFEQQEKLLKGVPDQWPRSIELELACNACGKRYHYHLGEVHVHPHDSEHAPDTKEATVPYKAGVVLCDDLRCKNCGELNRLGFTQTTLAQITAESLKLLALQRSGVAIPQYYPLKRVEVAEKDKELKTLSAIEKEHLESVGRYPGKPQPYLALGKFYEYVKVFPKSKEFYLKGMDMDSMALEGMAGLARIYHAEGNLREAYDWVDRCYMALAKGHLYLTESAADFKKTVREKRREYARELGVRPEDEPVEIRFRAGEQAGFPKNRPCPCGSGKKYKLCCMDREKA